MFKISEKLLESKPFKTQTSILIDKSALCMLNLCVYQNCIPEASIKIRILLKENDSYLENKFTKRFKSLKLKQRS